MTLNDILLSPINEQSHKHLTKWICICPECQHERIVTYSQMRNIKNGTSSYNCKSCNLRLGLTKINDSSYVLKNKDVQEKSRLKRFGIKRKSTSIRLQYEHLFYPEKMLTPEIRLKQRLAKLGRYEITNCITLCRKCHVKTDNFAGKARR